MPHFSYPYSKMAAAGREHAKGDWLGSRTSSGLLERNGLVVQLQHVWRSR